MNIIQELLNAIGYNHKSILSKSLAINFNNFLLSQLYLTQLNLFKRMTMFFHFQKIQNSKLKTKNLLFLNVQQNIITSI